jgi:hypothetical protein
MDIDPERLIKLVIMVESGLPTHKIADLLGGSPEALWHTWARVTDRSVWSLRQTAILFSLPGGVMPTLAQCRTTDMRIKSTLNGKTN